MSIRSVSTTSTSESTVPTSQMIVKNDGGSRVANQVGQQKIEGGFISIGRVYNKFRYTKPVSKPKNQDPNKSLSVQNDNVLASLEFPRMLDRSGQIDRAHPGTCEWIFEHDLYKEWIAQKCGLLWIKGKPGTGKSTIMSFLHADHQARTQRQQPTPITLHFFFTARGVELQKSFLGMLRSLLAQLFRQDESIQFNIREAYIRNPRRFAPGVKKRKFEWQRNELEQLFLTAVKTSAQNRSLIIFADALDEAGEEAAMIARYFHDINKQIHDINKNSQPRSIEALARAKICISCRHYPVSSILGTIEIVIDDHNGNDIRKFINDRIGLHGSVNRTHSKAELERWKSLIERMALNAEGVFQWVHLVVPIVEKWLGDARPYNRASQLLNQLPRALEDIYHPLLQRVIDSEYQSQSVSFFQWTCLANRPLSVSELRYALAAQHISLSPLRRCHEYSSFLPDDDQMQGWITTLSGGLAQAVRQPDSDTLQVQVVHQTVSEFLRSQGWEMLASSSQEEFSEEDFVAEFIKRSHSMLYWSCIKYLATDEVAIGWKAVPDQIKPGGSNGDKKQLQSSPLATYAAVNFLSHAEKAGKYRSENIEYEVRMWQRILPQWIEIYATIDSNAERRPKPGSTVLHIAAAANMVDIVEMLVKSERCEIDVLDQVANTPLDLAIQRNNTTVAKILVRSGARLTKALEWQDTPVTKTAKAGNLLLFNWLVGEVLELENSANSLVDTLDWAVSSGNIEVIDALVSLSADANIYFDLSASLMKAVRLEEGEIIVRSLIAAGADVNAKGGTDDTALQIAVINGHQEIVRVLLEHNAIVDASALQTAIINGHEEMVNILLQHDVNVDGSTLVIASRTGHEEIVNRLLKSGLGEGRHHLATTKSRPGSIMNKGTQSKMYGSALRAAVESGHTGVARLLLKAGAAVDDKVLQAAASNGSVEIIGMLPNATPKVKTKGISHNPALQAAVNGGHEDTVRLLLPAIPDRGSSVLQAAVIKGHVGIVQTLLSFGADVNCVGAPHGSALRAAIRLNDERMVRILLRARADISALGGSHTSPLLATAKSEYGSKLQIPSESHEIVNILEEANSTPLQLAIINGGINIVRLLLDAGAGSGITEMQYAPALQFACKYQREEIVQKLLEMDVNVNTIDENGRSALQAAISSGNQKIVKTLLGAGANIDFQRGQYGSALETAVRFGHADIVRTLLEVKTDGSAEDGQYDLALQLASEHGHVPIVQQLLLAGADANAPAGLRGSALQVAVIYGHDEVVKILLKAGAKINAHGGLRGSALQAAADKGHEVIVKTLLEAGADVNIRIGIFGSALECALRHQYHKIVRMLLEAGADETPRKIG